LCNEGAKGGLVDVFGKSAYILPIAPINAKEVSQLETRREAILEGMRSGARRVIELFLPAITAELSSSSSEGESDQDKTVEFLRNLTVEDIVNQLFPKPGKTKKNHLHPGSHGVDRTSTVFQGAKIE
jgi:hypothetical protein